MVQKKQSKTVTTQLSSKSWFEQVLDGTKYPAKNYGLFFFILGTLLYFNTAGNKFSMDDNLVTFEHHLVKEGFSGIPKILTSPYMNEERIKGEFRPLAQITFAIEYQFFGENPHINHLGNVLLYGLICMLIYKLFTRIFEEKYHNYIFIGTLIFAIHPLHTEVVASIKNRENLLGTLMGIVAVFQAIKHFELGKIKHFFFVLVFLLLGILAKMDSIVFVFFIILIAIYKKKYKSILPYFVSAVVILGLFLLYKFSIIPDRFRDTKYYETPLVDEDKTFLNRFKLSMITLWYYLKLNIFPYPLRFYYGTGLINIPAWSNPIMWLSFVIHSVMLFFGIRGTIKRQFYGFAILWYLGNVFLFSQLPEVVMGIVAERHVFIGSIGFAMLTSFGLIKLYNLLAEKNKESAKAVVWGSSIVGIIFIGMVLNRNKDWYDATTLYLKDRKHLDESIFAHYEMGNQFARDTGNDPKAPQYMEYLQLSVDEYKQVIDKMPDHTSAWYNMGVSYLRMGKWVDAKETFLQARHTDSTFRSVNHLIGISSLFAGDTLNGMYYLEKELTVKPNNGATTDLIYRVYSKKQQYTKILDVLVPVLESGVENTILLKAVANAYYFSGNVDEAMKLRKKIETHDYIENDNSEW